MGNAIILSSKAAFRQNNLGQITFIMTDSTYLCINALEDITVSFTNNLEYNDGVSVYWKPFPANTEMEVTEGDTLILKGNLTPTQADGIGTFSISGECTVAGHVIGLLENDKLVSYSFKKLFENCTGITDVSALLLPDEVEQSCYEGMFKGCTSIKISPALIAESLSIDCYKEMFYGCSSLNYIIIKSLDSLGEDYSENWTYGVSETGEYESITNVEHAQGVNGIPIGWESVTNFANMYFTIESLQDSNAIKMQRAKTANNPILSYSLDDGETWNTVTVNSTVTFATINTGDKIIFKGTNTKFASAWDTYNYFSATKQFKVYGNIMSIINGDDFKENSEFDSSSTHHFAGLLRTTYLVDASNLILPALTIYTSSYNGMFRGATALQHGPQMLATTPTGTECCSSMFEGCINLEEPIEINFTTLSQQCCFRMFCMNRTAKITTPKMTKSPILKCNTAATDCYKEMFEGNGNLNEITCLLTSSTGGTTDWVKYAGADTGTFYKHPSKNDWPNNNASGIPTGWTVEDYVE